MDTKASWILFGQVRIGKEKTWQSFGKVDPFAGCTAPHSGKFVLSYYALSACVSSKPFHADAGQHISVVVRANITPA